MLGYIFQCVAAGRMVIIIHNVQVLELYNEDIDIIFVFYNKDCKKILQYACYLLGRRYYNTAAEPTAVT